MLLVVSLPRLVAGTLEMSLSSVKITTSLNSIANIDRYSTLSKLTAVTQAWTYTKPIQLKHCDGE